MKNQIAISLSILLGLLFRVSLGASEIAIAPSAGNPFVTSIFTADPSAHVWQDGRLYVYPSRDIDPPKGCDRMDRYHSYSTDDMVHWRDEGELLRASQLDWGRPEGGFMWAPDCACRNGVYYFYFPHPSGTNWNDSWKIGVATSDKPASGFKPAGYIKGIGGFAMIDPAVFTDTDGQAYLYFGGGGKCVGVRLKETMTELDGELRSMEGLVDFHEATWVFKRNGLYYLTYADNNPRENRLCYAISKNPLGPWEYKGVYLEPTGCDTSHGSVVEFKGQWYAFYHNIAISGKGNLRSICVDRLELTQDGSIKTVVQTKTGVPAAGPHIAPPPYRSTAYKAEKALLSEGATIASQTEGKSVNLPAKSNATLVFESVDGGSNGGRFSLDITHANAALAKLKLTVNSEDQSLVNAVTTGSIDRFTGHLVITIPLSAGNKNILSLTLVSGELAVDHITITPL